jgi:hypothetical protein
MKAQLRRGLQELALVSGWSSQRAAAVGRPRILMYYRPIAEGALPPAVFEAQLDLAQAPHRAAAAARAAGPTRGRPLQWT